MTTNIASASLESMYRYTACVCKLHFQYNDLAKHDQEDNFLEYTYRLCVGFCFCVRSSDCYFVLYVMLLFCALWVI